MRMFEVTTKTNYGLLAILHLADHFNKDIVQIHDIVEERKVPRNYLEQIMNRLNKQGIVRSIRGKRGGFQLAKDPDRMTLLEVLKALEGEIALQKSTRIGVLRSFFSEIEAGIVKTLDIPLTKVLARQKMLEENIVFHI